MANRGSKAYPMMINQSSIGRPLQGEGSGWVHSDSFTIFGFLLGLVGIGGGEGGMFVFSLLILEVFLLLGSARKNFRTLKIARFVDAIMRFIYGSFVLWLQDEKRGVVESYRGNRR